jgi:ABC-type branched-subunit amino acid transport system substrate-binding protein/uncharacterized caspase-like protein
MANWAIVVGINRYQRLSSLKYADQDAQRMCAFLRDELQFEEVFLFTDSSESIQAQGGNITTSPPTFGTLRGFLNRNFKLGDEPLLKAGDNLWFFFAGHGQRDRDEDYLMLSDSDPREPNATAISVSFITEKLQYCGADNVVLFLDVCRDKESGARGSTSINSYPGVIIFYSCQPSETSWEIGAPINQGAFSHVLMQILRGESNPRCATVAQFEDYLRDHVSQLTLEHKKRVQTPTTKYEPRRKRSLILLPRFATPEHISQLKNDAYQAELNKDGGLAWLLWIRILEVGSEIGARADQDALNAFRRLRSEAPEQQPLSEEDLGQITDSVNSSDGNEISHLILTENPDGGSVTSGTTFLESGSRSTNNTGLRLPPLPRKPWSIIGLICCGFAVFILLSQVRILIDDVPTMSQTSSSPSPSPTSLPIQDVNQWISYGKKNLLKLKYNPTVNPEQEIYRQNTQVSQNLASAPVRTIAVVLPTEEDAALHFLYGVAQAQAQAIEDGLGLQVAIVNDGNKDEQATAVAQWLVKEEEKVLGVVGHYLSATTCTALKIYSDANLPVISPASRAYPRFRESCPDENKVFFRTANSTTVEAQALGGYLKKQFGENEFKVVAFYNKEDRYSGSLFNEFKSFLENNSSAKITDSLHIRKDSPVNFVNAIAAADVLAVFPDGTDDFILSESIRLIKEFGGNKEVVAANTLYFWKALHQMSGSVPPKNIILSVDWHPNQAEAKYFSGKASGRWGGGINFRTALGYEATQALADALTTGTVDTRLKLKDAITRSQGFNSQVFDGRLIKFDGNGNRSGVKNVCVRPSQTSEAFTIEPTCE